MRQRIMVAVAALMLFLIAGVLLTAFTRSRAISDDVSCLNNLREHGQFVGIATGRNKGGIPKKPDEITGTIPAGTLFNADLPVEDRLSWIAGELPNLNQKRQPTAKLNESLDRSAAWKSESNIPVGTVRLIAFTCPARPPEPLAEGFFPTSYVGNGGIGDDAPTLGFGPPIPVRLGAFQFSQPTPIRTILEGDGLANSILFAEVSADLGPWIRGGPSTVRALDIRDSAKPFLGEAGQFGGNHRGGTAFGFADGSVRFFAATSTNRPVIQALFTIAGAGFDPIPGE